MIAEELDRVLDEDYLGDLDVIDTDDLRARRADCQQVEAKLSFLRRLVQGRLDIVSAELERRAGGAAAGDLSDLVERLPQILADKGRAPGPGRLPTNLVPPDDEDLTVELDAISGPDTLGALPEMEDEQLQDISNRLSALERQVSGQRRAIFGVLDALEAELTARLQGEVAGAEA
jgi:hypothetical protein